MTFRVLRAALCARWLSARPACFGRESAGDEHDTLAPIDTMVSVDF